MEEQPLEHAEESPHSMKVPLEALIHRTNHFYSFHLMPLDGDGGRGGYDYPRDGTLDHPQQNCPFQTFLMDTALIRVPNIPPPGDCDDGAIGVACEDRSRNLD